MAVKQWFNLQDGCQYLREKTRELINQSDIDSFVQNQQLSVFFKLKFSTPHFMADSRVLNCFYELTTIKHDTKEANEYFIICAEIDVGIYEIRLKNGGYEFMKRFSHSVALEPYTRIVLTKKIKGRASNACLINHSDGFRSYSLDVSQPKNCVNYIDRLDFEPSPIRLQQIEEWQPSQLPQELELDVSTLLGEFGFTLGELDRFIKAQAETPETQTTNRPTTISNQHRANLLRTIKAEGLDALQLVEGKYGKAGSKAQLKSLLVPNHMTESQFKNTWERAKADEVIQYKK